ncbi:hypothetical protein [Bradyrhizobium liaoningense]|uniref:ATP dependent DNA ligase n=1 Tax=Bradyrhizobium liaoningense TaxID=43992 RepID=UPI0039089442
MEKRLHADWLRQGLRRPTSETTEATDPDDTALREADRPQDIWVQPKLLAEVMYWAKSAERKVRHAFFKGLREEF